MRDSSAYGHILACIRARDFESALAPAQKLVSENPSDVDAHFALEHVRAGLCDWEGWHQRCEKNLQILEQEVRAGGGHRQFPLCYISTPLSSSLFFALAKGAAAGVAAFATGRQDSGRLRVGFLSMDFKSHSAGLSLEPVAAALDRAHFEVFAYSAGAMPAWGFDAIHDVRGKSPQAIAELLEKHSLDVLVETTQHILGSLEAVSCFAPARRVVSAWGYGATSGYGVSRLVDRAMLMTEPAGSVEPLTEQVLMVPQYHPIPPLVGALRVGQRGEYGLPEGAILLGHFNATYKLQPEVFESWCRILSSVPESRLLLLEQGPVTRGNLHRELMKRGLPAERILFVPRLPWQEHLSRLSCLDLMLDNPLFGGGATLVDGLYAAVPGVTFAGDGMQSNSGRSIYEAFGLSAQVAQGLRDYADLAIRTLESRIESKKAAACAQQSIVPRWGEFKAALNDAFRADVTS